MKKLVSIGFLAVVVAFNFQLSTLNSYAAEMGLVGWWKFDEGSGEVVRDASGKGHDGEIKGAEWTKGLSGSALSFNIEEKTSVVVPDADDLNPSQITVEVWFKTDSIQSDKQLVNKATGGKWGYRMTIAGNKISWQIPGSEKSWSYGMQSTIPFNLNEWAFATGTYDNKTMRIYINGKESGVMERSGEIINSERPLIIGNFTEGNVSAGFTGLIDEIRIYNRALTPDEIQKHWEEGFKKVGQVKDKDVSQSKDKDVSQSFNPVDIKPAEKVDKKEIENLPPRRIFEKVRPAFVADSTSEAVAREILEATGVKGGLVVHFGCGDGRLTAALRANESYLVHGLDSDAASVEKAREYIRSLGFYGKVSVEQLKGNRLPYIDNLVNLFVTEDLRKIPVNEVMRVLCPNGVAYIKEGGKWTKKIKPRPREIDEWTHYLHDAGNNAVAHDSVIGPPYHIQWTGEPRFARHHERLSSISAVVSSGGRLFCIVDEGSKASLLFPPKWFLVARDAFNGIILWKRSIASWAPHLWMFFSGPPELSRRLVATGEMVYATLGYDAPVTALDAATGKTVKTYEGTEGTEEIIYDEGILFIVTGVLDIKQSKGPRWGTESKGIEWGVVRTPPEERSIMAIDAKTGKVLWKESEAKPFAMTLAAREGRVFFQNPEAVVCLDSKTGRQLWRTARASPEERGGWSAPTLVVYGDVVLSADRNPDVVHPPKEAKTHSPEWAVFYSSAPGKLLALSAKTGKELWSCESTDSFRAPPDIFVADGLVWIGQVKSRHKADFTSARDLHTGEVKREISTEKAFTNVHHHRCYRNKATDKYILLARTGTEFIDLKGETPLRHTWARGACQYGIMPANGLLYLPSHSCACYIQSKLDGFNALAPKRKSGIVEAGEPYRERIEYGPAYGKISGGAVSSDDWHTYRHDSARSGFTKSKVPVELKQKWQANLEAKLSSPVIAEGKVFVAKVDEHAVFALDANSGKTLWSYTAGGRVDSPPTIYKGMAIFGCADGWVYCLSSSDGNLAWRFRAAPVDQRTVSYGQVESVWRLHGSVLVQNGAVYCVAGRSSYLDGGIHLYRLDPKTGEPLTEKRIYSRDPETGEETENKGMELPGALPDVLSSDSDIIYLRHLGFHPGNLEEMEPRRHLFSSTGFLDDNWWHRSYWIFGTWFKSGAGGWFLAGREFPAGRLLVFDDSSIYGYGYKPDYYRWTTELKYRLFSADKEPEVTMIKGRQSGGLGLPDRKFVSVEFQGAPILVRAMALADTTLFIAGPPQLVDEAKVYRNLHPGCTTPQEIVDAEDAFEGKKGALLCAFSKDGEKLKEYNLESLPIFDGMAAANGQLYFSAQDGKVFCLE